MASILTVPDSYEAQETLLLAGAGGRNLPVTAVPTASLTPQWRDVLAAGNDSGANDPTITLLAGIAFEGEPLGPTLGGFISVDTGDGAFVISSRESATTVYNLFLRAADSPSSPGGSVRITPGSGVAGSNGTAWIESVAIGPTVTVSDSGLAFFDGAAAHKPSVTGSRAGNAALASLLSRLASMGLITDNTTP